MKDERIKKLAGNLLNYSCKLKKGQSVIIEGSDGCKELIIELVGQTYKMGCFPFVRLGNSEISRAVLMGLDEEYSKRLCKYAIDMYKDADAYIGISASDNIFESADVPSENKQIHSKFYGKPIHIDIRVKKTNWVILRYPNASFAQLGQMSTEAFEDFYFNVCNLDYGKMAKAMKNMQKLMEKTDKVRLVTPDTDLTFSIKGQPAKICAGECNIPDGEIYTAPIKDSINGHIHFNIPSPQEGVVHNDITLEFKNGRIVGEKSSNTSALTHKLNVDEGARGVGEFAIGVNPYITKPMYDILFDEKMAGSIHMAMGNCYDDVPNGNHSQNHWDMVLSMTPENGGGEIYFDDVLIRKDGQFVLPELKCLNPENLK
ncbi:MAG: aminopeptidase [Christensenellaceae bacterium]|jgi:aminopeptidase|nr:aminopeptidase [Christensenellaceae bacterium]